MASHSPQLTAFKLHIDPEDRFRGADAAWRRYNRLPKLLVLSVALHVCTLVGLNLLEREAPTKIETATEIPIELVTAVPDSKPPPKPEQQDVKQKPEPKKKEAEAKPVKPIEPPKPPPPVEKAQAKPEPKPQPKPVTEAKTETKPEPKPESKPQQQAAKAEIEKSSGVKPPPPPPKLDAQTGAKANVAAAKPAPAPPPPPPPPAPKPQLAAVQPKSPEPKPVEPKTPAPKPVAPAPKPQDVQAKPPPPVEKPQPPPQLAALQQPASAPKQASADSEPKPLSPMAREVRSQEQLLEQALGGPAPNSLTPSPVDPTGQTDQKLPASGAMQGQDDPLRAVAVPSATADGDILVAYKTLVFSKLELAKKYPEEARKRRAHGSAVIDFVLDDKGQVQRVDLVQSSGDQALDAESQSLVFRAAPFPPPPAGAQKEFGAVIVFSPRN